MPTRGRPARQEIHKRLASEIAEMRKRLGGLPRPEEAEDIWTGIWYREAHNSTALEGNTLVQREVETLLAEGRVVGSKQLKDYLEVQGYADAARWVYAQGVLSDYQADSLLTVTEVRHVHSVAMTPVWQVAPHPQAHDNEAPGSWRRHNIEAFPGGMTPPDHPEVPVLMLDWVREVEGIPEDDGPIAEALARRHVRFEQIHPFLDGNGRTGRLLTNLVLVRLGYPPAIIQQRDRPRYLDSLRKADSGDIGPLGELFARSILDNLMQFVLPAIAGPLRLLPLDALAGHDVTQPSLAMAAQRGRLRAIRGVDGRWRSTRQWVDDYLAHRYQRSGARETVAPNP